MRSINNTHNNWLTQPIHLIWRYRSDEENQNLSGKPLYFQHTYHYYLSCEYIIYFNYILTAKWVTDYSHHAWICYKTLYRKCLIIQCVIYMWELYHWQKKLLFSVRRELEVLTSTTCCVLSAHGQKNIAKWFTKTSWQNNHYIFSIHKITYCFPLLWF